MAVSKTKNPEDKRGAVKAIQPKRVLDRRDLAAPLDDVKDDDDDDGEFCFGRERGFKTTLEREV